MRQQQMSSGLGQKCLINSTRVLKRLTAHSGTVVVVVDSTSHRQDDLLRPGISAWHLHGSILSLRVVPYVSMRFDSGAGAWHTAG